MRKLSLRYGLVFANSGMLLIHFLPDDIKLIPFKCVTVGQLHLALEALRNALYKFKTYLLTYLLIGCRVCETVKLLCRKKPDFIPLDC